MAAELLHGTFGVISLIVGSFAATHIDDLMMLVSYTCPDAGGDPTMSTFNFEPIGVALSSDAPRLTNLAENYSALLPGTGMIELPRPAWFEKANR
jgi:hypothetical protein